MNDNVHYFYNFLGLRDTIENHTGILFKNEWNNKDIQKKLDISTKIINFYEDKIPIIILPVSNKSPELYKYKFICGSYCTIINIMSIIKKNIVQEFGTNQYSSIYILFNNNTMPDNNQILGYYYDAYKADDGFLYIYYDTESVFG